MTRSVLYVAVAMFALLASYFAVAATQRPTTVPGYLVVTTCGTLPSGVVYTAGSYQAGTISVTGTRC